MGGGEEEEEKAAQTTGRQDELGQEHEVGKVQSWEVAVSGVAKRSFKHLHTWEGEGGGEHTKCNEKADAPTPKSPQVSAAVRW